LFKKIFHIADFYKFLYVTLNSAPSPHDSFLKITRFSMLSILAY